MNAELVHEEAEEISYFSAKEREITEQYLKQGYVCLPVENKNLLTKIRQRIAMLAAQVLQTEIPKDESYFLNNIFNEVTPQTLNQLRLHIINGLSQTTWFNSAYFQLAKSALSTLVGNELVMQRGIGLSVQLPHDTSSLLNVHADSWSGDSPFEVVVWLPLVDCYKTKSMYILPPEKTKELNTRFSEFDGMSNDELFSAIEKDVVFVDVPYGYFLLFDQNLPHGNRVNEENETRWTMNRRFKSLFSPYADKKFGEFFDPITLRAATRVGMSHKFPRVSL